MELKRVGNSKFPTQKTLNTMTFNLFTKLGKAAKIEVSTWQHEVNNSKSYFNISLVPGLEGSECSIFYLNSWKELLTKYRKLMSLKGE